MNPAQYNTTRNNNDDHMVGMKEVETQNLKFGNTPIGL